MNSETIVAVYDSSAHADAAIAELHAAGIPDSDISRHADMEPGEGVAAPQREEGFWSSLFGGGNHDADVYDRSMQSGSSVVAVRVTEAQAAHVTDVLERHDPVDLEERAATYGSASAGYGVTHDTGTTAAMPFETGTMGTMPMATGTMAGATHGTTGETLQLSEEELAVGKRAIARGTTRVRRYVVETPVEKSVSLHDERVTLERHPVTDGRVIGDADFSDKTIEMTATGEEVLVSKTARVVEEVSLRKESTERVETVRDTLRKDAVEIEEVPGTDTVLDTRKPLPR